MYKTYLTYNFSFSDNLNSVHINQVMLHQQNLTWHAAECVAMETTIHSDTRSLCVKWEFNISTVVLVKA